MKYKISELAKVLGVTANTIRRYENEGYIVPYRDASGYRWYTEGDIAKIASIRLYRKCDFSHQSIKKMLNSHSDEITAICEDKLAEMDEQIQTLQHLRHWLKDNIKLMHTLESIDSGFMIMNCPPLKYVLYSVGDKLLTENKRLKTINDFMYAVHEVQLIQLRKLEDIKNHKNILHRGWALKDMDIERLNLYDIVTEDNEFIVNYPMQKCLYGVLKIQTPDISANENNYTLTNLFIERAESYMQKNNLELSGDVMSFIVNNLGNTSDMLVCMPVKETK